MKIPYFSKFTINSLLILCAALALFFRSYNITHYNFIFYDEGMYLDYNRAFLQIVANNPPKNLSEFFIILKMIFNAALATPKALWFFIVNLRVFVVGEDGLYFSRVISAVSGILTVGLTFLWAKQYFKSVPIAIISALLLALLPSHVFYSRQGMQEALSCLLFLLSLYAFIFSKKGFSFMVIMSGFMMFAVFMTNYRMIVGPIFIFLFIGYEYFVMKKVIDFKKLSIFLASFILGFIVLAILQDGINLKVNLAWMMNQAGESGQYRQWYNFFSFPYYVFKLENVLFGIIFFGSFYFCLKLKFQGLLPFLIVILQMFLFSFAAEKGSRYLCVVLPFMCMAVAFILSQFYQKSQRVVGLILIIMILGFMYTLSMLVTTSSSYQKAIAWLKNRDEKALIISTQPMIEKLFVSQSDTIVALPNDIPQLADLVQQGYRYLIIDPQLYVSWTKDQKRFSFPEKDFIVYLRARSQLIATLPHFNAMLLERFVLDHNQDLKQSLNFLSTSGNHGDIYIYDLGV